MRQLVRSLVLARDIMDITEQMEVENHGCHSEDITNHGVPHTEDINIISVTPRNTEVIVTGFSTSDLTASGQLAGGTSPSSNRVWGHALPMPMRSMHAPVIVFARPL